MHFMKPAVSSSLFRFFPMKIILQRRSSPAAHDPCCELANSMWMAWKTYFSFMPLTARTPFERKRSTPFSFRSQPIHSFNFCGTTSPAMSMPTEETRSSCWWSALSCRKASSIAMILSRENPRMPRTKSMSTSLFVVRLIGTISLIARIRRSTSSRSSSVSTRSHLLSRILSANAICSTASFSTPSGFSSSRCCTMCFASTSVRMPSRR
mmetsp:Transcript_79101/g.246318  ORF Transcript_79101/g.246318 Transcript_79101/m.246318 type:complete len:209 (+) Transcript_79101:164-790(+)